MIMSLISHALSAWFAFLLPSFATFKALSHRPLSEPDLEKWATYWCVIGAFVAFEYVAEWFISWLPFYWELKTIFLLFLSLPQTEGHTWVYNTYLQPFFQKNEADLDAGIVSVQRNTLTFLQERLAGLWDFLLGLINKNAARAPGQPTTQQPGAPAAQPGSPIAAAMNLWNTYGASVVGAIQGMQSKTANTAAAPTTPSPYGSTSGFQASSASLGQRGPGTPGTPGAPPPFPVPEFN